MPSSETPMEIARGVRLARFPIKEGLSKVTPASATINADSLRANVITLACGFGTSLLAAILLLLLQRTTGTDLFSWMYAWAIPLGAVLTGMVAASGYFLGARRWHAHPSTELRLAIVVITAMLQFAIYYTRYETAEIRDGELISDHVGFLTFTKYALSHQVYRERSGSSGTQVGDWGYVIALVQFLGLILGALLVFLVLGMRPYCTKCGHYAKAGPKFRFHLDIMGSAGLMERLDAMAPLSAAYWAEIDSADGTSSVKGLDVELFACTDCGRQAVVHTPTTRVGNRIGRDYARKRVIWADAGPEHGS